MERLVVCAVLLAGCGFNTAGSKIDATDVVDDGRPIDLALEGGVGCYGTGLIEVCFVAPPTGTFTVPQNPYLDTDVDANCTIVKAQAGGPSVCVVAAEAISISSYFRPHGVRPLVLIGAATVTVEAGGTIDVSSNGGSTGDGAGANGSPCTAPSAGVDDTGSSANAGAGGAGGGGFGDDGGDGGNGSGASKGAKGAKLGAIASVRGGCAGARGGNNNNNGGLEGRGGGAVYVIAGTSITIAGEIEANGDRGSGGGNKAGGGGGGSGGLIGIDAQNVTIVSGAQVYANGGGGGEGGGCGASGDDGTTSSSATTGGSGGANNNCGGNGGNGGIRATVAGGAGGTASNGGGGGGGGVGIIRVFGTSSIQGTLSPAPS